MKKYSVLKDRVSLLTICCLSFVFILVIVLSFGVRFFFRPGIDDGFWGDLAFAFALVIYCLYFGIMEGKSYHEKKVDGRYQTALNDFKKIREVNINKDVYFNQWLTKYYERNKSDYFKAILSSHGNINPLVLDLDISELENLKNPYMKDWKGTEFEGREVTYFRSLTEDQIDIIKDIFKGKINVERIPDDFFKTHNGKVITSEYIEQSKSQKKNTKQFVMLIVLRVVMLIVVQTILTIFGIRMSEASGKEEILNRIITTLSRLINMITSFTYGYTVGKIMVVNRSVLLEYKARVNKEFDSDKTFVGLDENELAKVEYNKWKESTK